MSVSIDEKRASVGNTHGFVDRRTVS